MIIATMASLASRSALLEKTVASLRPQVDAICVYLNGYSQIPDFLRQPKILHAVLSVEAGWRGAEGKLWFWDDEEFKAAPRWDQDDVAIICDDDIIYPANYVKQMMACLGRHPGAVACVHSSIMMEPFERYATSRMVARTVCGLDKETQVHIPGTGTMAFRVGDVMSKLSLRRDFQWSHAVDPQFAVWCRRYDVPVWSVARPPRWLVTQELPKSGMAIFATRTGMGNDTAETKILIEGGPWPRLPVAHDMTPRAAQVARGTPNKSPAVQITENPGSMLPEEAFEWLGDKFREMPGGYVVEFGSGHGTQRLINAMPTPGPELVSVEHDPAFVGLIDGANYIHAPIHNGWYDTRTLKAKLPARDQIAAVIVDGPPSRIGRSRLRKNLDLFPERVPMLIDDVHRAPELELAKAIANERGEQLALHRCGARAFATIGWA